MANMDTGAEEIQHKKTRGVKRAKKLNTKVDMTPMVDLGFLLITFFIFTSTMMKPGGIDLAMPKEDDNSPTNIKESGSLTIMIGKDNSVFYYEGVLVKDASNFYASNFKEIRDIIIKKRKEVIANHKHDHSCEGIRINAQKLQKINWENADLDRDLMVVIKPSPDANFQNTVDILDEMTINTVKRFTIVKIDPEELKLVKASKG